MKKFRKISIMVLITFLFSNVINIGSIKTVQAYDDVNIISNTNVTSEQAKVWAKNKGATDEFVKLADYYWQYCKTNGEVNPAIAYAQAALETGYGKFGGVLTAEYKNPCGLKNSAGGDDGDPAAHHKFNTWQEGVQAHLDHLALYADAKGYPRKNTYDPRHTTWIQGKGKTVKQMAASWATDKEYSDKILRLYNELIKLANNTPKMYLNNLKQVSTASENYIDVQGWGLNSTGIKEVKIYLDGAYKGTASYGIKRQDIYDLYPDYPNALNSGYAYKINADGLSEGSHTVKADVIANDGTVNSMSKTVKTSNPIARVYLNNLKQVDNTKENYIDVQGWALHRTGIKQIKVYLDGKYVNTAVYGSKRQDIYDLWPNYPNALNSGFAYKLSTDSLATGNHTVKVDAVANDGTVNSMSKTIQVTKAKPIMYLNNLKQVSTAKENYIDVQGWGISRSGIKQVKIYLDGSYKGTATYGSKREDIYGYYPTYPNSLNSGYVYKLNADGLSEGNHTVKAEVIANDGTVETMSKTVKTSNPIARVYLNNLKQVSTAKENYIDVQGWALHRAGIKQVKVYIDGKYVSTASYGSKRQDIYDLWPNYPNALNSGFAYKLNADGLSEGSHTVKVEAVANDGTVNTMSKTVKTTNPIPRVYLNNLKQVSTAKENYIDVQGWALNRSGIKQIKVYIDGRYVSTASYGSKRQDIYDLWPNYPNALNSGFAYKLNADGLNEGSHTVKVEAVANDGTVNTMSKTVKTTNPIARVYLNNLKQVTSTTENYIDVQGWALHRTGIKQIKVYVDGKYVSTASYGSKRQDIYNLWPNYPNALNSGFAYKLDAHSLSGGTHTVKVDAVANDGTVNSMSKTVSVVRKLIVIDPGHLGHDSGACAFNETEANLNAGVAVKLQKVLEGMGYSTYMTRSPLHPNQYASLDTTAELRQRADAANNLKADLFISLHHDSGGSSSSGMWTFYSSWKPGLKNVQADLVPLKTGFDGWEDTKPTEASKISKTFGQKVQNNLTSKCGYPAVRSNVVDRNLSVTVHTNMPSVLIELGFMTNKNELTRCQSTSGQQQKAQVIADTVKSMF